MDKNARRCLKERTKLSKVFDLDYLTDNDKLNIDVICSCKDLLDTGSFVSKNSYSLDFVKESSIEAMKLFDPSIADRAFNIMSFTNVIQIHDLDFHFNTGIKYGTLKRNVVDPTFGYVDLIGTPRNLNDNAFILLGHELMHAIKDTNYLEYKLQLVLSEVIPDFYEMIIADSIPEISKMFWSCRLEIIKTYIDEYEGISDKLSKTLFDRKLYKHLLSVKGVYLNSFYYALVLYNLYKLKPDWVMKNVLLVLDHEMTTKDLLIKLGIYEMNNDRLVSDEIKRLSYFLK